MYIAVHANGVNEYEGTHISVLVYLMRGEFDGSLTWPFTGSVTVTLLNQLQDRNHHQVTIEYPDDRDDSVNRRVVDGERARRGYGNTHFISHEALNYHIANNCQYLKEDCLHFRVSATARNAKTWLS